MFCPKCGKNLNDESKFCDGCGSSLEKSPQKIPVPAYIGAAIVFFFIILGLASSDFTDIEGTLTGSPALEVQNHSFCNLGYGSKGVCGTVLNSSDRSFSYVQVEINLLDKSGAIVGSTIANINNLDAGKQWKFQAAIIEPNVASYVIKDITSF